VRRRTVLSGAVGALAAGLAASLPLRAAPLTLRFAHFAQADHPANVAAQQFAARVEARTDGAVKIEVHPNNQLGNPEEQAQQIKLGVIDMGLPTQGQLDKYDKAFAAIMLPFVFDDVAHCHRVLDGKAMEWLAPRAMAQGLVMLRNWEWGFRDLTNAVRPVLRPDDVRGLKIRTPPELQIQAAIEALGATVTTIAFTELYLALAQKVVDGQENPIAVIYYNKIYEVQRHLAITRHVYNNMIHVVSLRSWRRLSPTQRNVVQEESAAAGDLMRRLIAEQEADQVTRLTAYGVTLTRPDIAPFRARMEPAYARIAAYAGEDNVKTFRGLVEQAR
jgi:tripartite ATP-independent transporter DctP family solute receptor